MYLRAACLLVVLALAFAGEATEDTKDAIYLKALKPGSSKNKGDNLGVKCTFDRSLSKLKSVTKLEIFATPVGEDSYKLVASIAGDSASSEDGGTATGEIQEKKTKKSKLQLIYDSADTGYCMLYKCMVTGPNKKSETESIYKIYKMKAKAGESSCSAQNKEDAKAELESQVEECKAELAEKSTELAEKSAALDAKTKELAEKSAQLAETSSQLSEKSTALDEKTRESAQKSAQLAQKSAQLDQKTRELAQKSAELAQKSAQLDAKTRESAQKSAQLTQMSTQLDQKTRELAQKSAQLAQTSSALGQKTRELAQKSAQLDAKTRESAQKSAQLAQTSAALGQKTRELAQKSAQLAQTSSALGQKTRELAQKSAQLAQKSTALSRLQSVDGSKYHLSSVYKGRVYIVKRASARFNIHANNQECRAMGGYLVEFDDQAEQQFVGNFVRPFGRAWYFTGANDVASEGRFVYYNSKKPMTGVKWRPREPNQWGGNEDCVDVNYIGLNDIGCHATGRFICEIPLM